MELYSNLIRFLEIDNGYIYVFTVKYIHKKLIIIPYRRRRWTRASSQIVKETTYINSAIIDCGSGF